MSTRRGLLWLSLLALVGCTNLGPLRRPPDVGVSAPAAHVITVTATATETPTASPSATPSPSTTATATGAHTATPSPSPSRTATATPTITPTPVHPLDVEAMRQRVYPGSALIIEETLAPGINYERYIVSYGSDGLKLYALLTVPQGEAPARGWPVVVFNHGYIPPDVYRPTERYVAYVDAFARHGYIVLRPDYRGHGDSEGRASGSASPDYTIDVLNAVSSIKRFEGADPARIGMWGHSMGGGITLRSMVVTSDVVAGVIWAGVVASPADMARIYLQTPTPEGGQPSARYRWIGETYDRYGTPEENPAFWAAISANAHVGDLSGPVQIHHGTVDDNVPLEYSLLLADEIKAAGGEVELYTYEGDDHNIARNWGTAMTRSVAFMDRWVKAAGAN